MAYAVNLRNYHPVNYDRIPERLEKEEEKRERRKQRKAKKQSQTIDQTENEKELEKTKLTQATIDATVARERDRINRINNGFASQKAQQHAAPRYNSQLHPRNFDTAAPKIVNSAKGGVAFLPPINKTNFENLKKNAESIKIENASEPRHTSVKRRAANSRIRGSDSARGSQPASSLLDRLEKRNGSHKRNSVMTHRDGSGS